MKIYYLLRTSIFAIIIVLCSTATNGQTSEAIQFPKRILLPKSTVDSLLISSYKMTKLVLVQINTTKDLNRRYYELVLYAYNDKNLPIKGFKPYRMKIPAGQDTSFNKDIYLGSYTITKSTFTTLLPKLPYSYMAFNLYNDELSEDLYNYVSYSVFAVAADGITGVKKEAKSTSITKLLLNPSPPR